MDASGCEHGYSSTLLLPTSHNVMQLNMILASRNTCNTQLLHVVTFRRGMRSTNGSHPRLIRHQLMREPAAIGGDSVSGQSLHLLSKGTPHMPHMPFHNNSNNTIPVDADGASFAWALDRQAFTVRGSVKYQSLLPHFSHRAHMRAGHQDKQWVAHSMR